MRTNPEGVVLTIVAILVIALIGFIGAASGLYQPARIGEGMRFLIGPTSRGPELSPEETRAYVLRRVRAHLNYARGKNTGAAFEAASPPPAGSVVRGPIGTVPHRDQTCLAYFRYQSMRVVSEALDPSYTPYLQKSIVAQDLGTTMYGLKTLAGRLSVNAMRELLAARRTPRQRICDSPEGSIFLGDQREITQHLEEVRRFYREVVGKEPPA